MIIQDVENLAELSKLELTQEEKESFLKDIESIVGYVKQIESVDVGDIEVEYPIHNIWREDLPHTEDTLETRESSKDLIMKQFPHGQDGYLKVKKIL